MTIMINKISPGEAPDCQAGRTMLLGWTTYICWSMNSLEKLKKNICGSENITSTKLTPTDPQNHFGGSVIQLNLQIMLNDLNTDSHLTAKIECSRFVLPILLLHSNTLHPRIKVSSNWPPNYRIRRTPPVYT
jgi:hypothetical protein